jgi:hypothetical protein
VLAIFSEHGTRREDACNDAQGLGGVVMEGPSSSGTCEAEMERNVICYPLKS